MVFSGDNKIGQNCEETLNVPLPYNLELLSSCCSFCQAWLKLPKFARHVTIPEPTFATLSPPL